MISDDKFVGMVGKKLERIDWTQGTATIAFAFQDGTVASFEVRGGCCSESWIEYLEAPDDVKGATIISAEDSDEITSDHDVHDNVEGERYKNHVQVYNTKFVTDRGTITLEYRNNSNGYYGGYLDRVS